MTKTFGGTQWIKHEVVCAEGTDQVDQAMLQRLYQAIFVDDSSFVYEPDVMNFVVKQHQQHDTSVIYMALEGIFDMLALQQAFSVNWRLSASTTRDIILTNAGHRMLSIRAFPFPYQYTKAHYVVSDVEDDVMFAEHINPADYQNDDSSVEDDPVPIRRPARPSWYT